MKRGFGSDNHAAVHPDILESFKSVNEGHEPSYGTDMWTQKACDEFRKHFGSNAEIFFVFNGTAANVTALKALTKSFHSVLCTDVSHIQNDECGAPEFMTGCKLIPIVSQDGKMKLEDAAAALVRRGDQHHSQIQVLSLTQPTELGSVYSLAELKELIHWAKSQKLFVHIDGARLANAAAYLGVSFKELTTDLGVDIVSMGGTKNGLMMGEAVIILNPSLANDFKYIRKQSGQLPSKSRYIAGQFLAYLQNNLWKKIADHSHQMALKLYDDCQGIAGFQIRQKPQSNAVFVKMPQPWVKKLKADYFFYVWDEHTFECRLMTSWDTQVEDIEGFVKRAKELSGEIPSRSLS